MTFTVALPIADRHVSNDFYRAVLDAEPFGPPGGDGLPEPLQFPVSDGVSLMLVPADGFALVIGDHRVAPAGTSECVLHRAVRSAEDVVAVIERARLAGGRVVAEPAEQPWGYCGVFADPDGHLWMVMPDRS